MADTELLSIVDTPADGLQTVFEFNFAGGYISREHVVVIVYDEIVDGVMQNPTEPVFTFLGDYSISIVPAPAAGKRVRIARNTPFSAPLVNFSDGSIVNEGTLDLNAEQAVFLAAELRDRMGTSVDLGTFALLADQVSADKDAAAASAASAASDAAELADSIETLDALRYQIPVVGTLQAIAGTDIGVPTGYLFRTEGYTTRTDGGAGVYAVVTTEPSHGGKVALAGGVWGSLVQQGETRPEQFGAKGDGITDDAVAIQAARDYVIATRGAQLLFYAKTYIVNSAIRLFPGCDMIGAGLSATIIKAGIDDIEVLGRNNSGLTGSLRIADMTIYGYADRNPTLGSQKLINVAVGLDTLTFERVRATYSRTMGITGVATRCNVIDCEVLKNHRDGINVTGSRSMHVRGNYIEEAGDDCIACHVAAAAVGVIDTEIRVIDNHARQSLGIKILGAKNCVVLGNTLKFWAGYGVNLAFDPTFGEGIGPRHGVVISGNTFEDGLNSSLLGSTGSQRDCILITGTESLGSGSTVWDVYEGQYSAALSKVRTPGPYINMNALTYPRPANSGIIISDNVFKQTLESKPDGTAATKWSDFGVGTLWHVSGVVDPTIATTIKAVRGIALTGAFRNVTITDNIFDGLSNAVDAAPTIRFNNLKFHNNSITRCTNGVVITGPSGGLHGKAQIDNNNFDLDPYFEEADRSALDGSWALTDGSTGFGVNLTNFYGTIVSDNDFANLRRPVKRTTANSQVSGNRYHWDWSSGAKGIALIEDRGSNLSFFRDGNPQSGTFGQYSTTADSGFVVGATAMPSTGYYQRGQFVKNETLAIATGKVLTGWLRLTGGNAHVSGTDWAPQYVSIT